MVDVPGGAGVVGGGGGGVAPLGVIGHSLAAIS